MRRSLLRPLLAGLAAGLAAGLCSSASYAFLPPSIGATQGDFGGVGLLQTPTARFEEVGGFNFGFSYAWPYSRIYISVQPLDFLEATIRYVTIKNRLYGPSIAGDQSYKDKGVDFKLRLWNESDHLPAAALGVRDIGGTGLFGSEYLVFSKRFYAWDFSLGLGWGYLGARGDLKNPLTVLDQRFETRSVDVGQGGTVGFGRMFRGERVGVFGGVSYQPRHSDWSLMLELDGNDYKNEPLDNSFTSSTPLNIGAKYRVLPWLELGLGYERGDTLLATVTLAANLDQQRSPPKLQDPERPVIGTSAGHRLGANIASTSTPAPDPILDDQWVEALGARFSQQHLRLEQLTGTPRRPHAVFSNRYYGKEPEAIGRAARLLTVAFPDALQVALTRQVQGVATYQVALSAQQVVKQATYQGSPEELLATASFGFEGKEPGKEAGDEAGHAEAANDAIAVNNDSAPAAGQELRQVATYPQFNGYAAPGFRQSIGGPDNFYFYQVLAHLNAELELTSQLALTGQLTFDVVNNLDSFKYESNSQLPHVRSDIKDYLRQGAQSLSRLQLDYVASPKKEWYTKVSAGYLEMMYAGAGAELLYQPFSSRVALGAELYYARQREFKQQLGFRDYSVLTGHLNAYYQSPWNNVLVKVSAGRYLAQDVGMTFDLSRRFDNGFSMGVFATFTDVSAEQFGEGSYDKGFYINIPFDALLAKSSQEVGTILWRPLTRDGGQKLQQGRPIYELMNRTQKGALLKDWKHF
tara:strand:+ start:4495 stop:6744 length:2250 start_codon:yes stop_codon:yes gene_type:complete